MNRITLTGRLTRDPQAHATNGGTQVTSLRIAVPRPRKEGADQGADFVDVTVFGRQAETCAEYLEKGRRVAIDGHLHHSEWDSEDGHRQRLEVIAQSVEFLSPPTRSGGAAEDEERQTVSIGGAAEEDIPF